MDKSAQPSLYQTSCVIVAQTRNTLLSSYRHSTVFRTSILGSLNRAGICGIFYCAIYTRHGNQTSLKLYHISPRVFTVINVPCEI